MRIISGTYKNKIVKGFDIVGTRPTMDRLKESMFAMIQTKIRGSVCLDLFAGSGNLGIEALSNGASACYFCDHNKIAYQTILENIKKIQIKEETHVLKMEYQDAFNHLKKGKVLLDLVFLDPPYGQNLISDTIRMLEDQGLLNEDAYIVCEHEEENITSHLPILKTRDYGSKTVTIYQYKKS